MATTVHARKGTRKLTSRERFEAKVDRNGPTQPHMDTPCHVWTAGTNETGYGQFKLDGATHYAHRVAYEMVNGPIPDGLCACHECDNPPCVNASHIFIGTHLDNANDRDAKGRAAQGDKNGSRLHPERRPRGDKHHFRTHPECCPRGDEHYNAKLTEADVREIRRRCAAGETGASVASAFGVARATVSKITHRVTWRSLDPDGRQEPRHQT